MNNKFKILPIIILLSIVIAVSGCVGQTAPVSDQTNNINNITSSVVSQSDIFQAIDDANTCEQDSDCTFIQTSEYFGCNVVLNKASESTIQNMIDSWDINNEQGTVVVADCLVYCDATLNCIDSKCVASDTVVCQSRTYVLESNFGYTVLLTGTSDAQLCQAANEACNNIYDCKSIERRSDTEFLITFDVPVVDAPTGAFAEINLFSQAVICNAIA
ncbi:MAG: hypothetical protein ABIA21_01350 [Candidatus Aenigmatarchaeota archaeon]